MALIRSWVESANDPEGAFPLNNLPCGVFSPAGAAPRPGVAIGDFVLDVAAAEAAGLLVLPGGPLLNQPSWNRVMAAGPEVWHRLRAALTALLAEGSDQRRALRPHLSPLSAVQLHLPFEVAEFTDFYAGYHHAVNVGTLFRGAENALPPNWLHIPVGYNGRASSVVVSGTDLHRPMGQLRSAGEERPRFAPSERFDFELELGAVVGLPSERGRRLTVAEADEMIFGYVLLNDWSARDIQAWEYQPLGPFQSKATATTLSPWIVTRAALEPFRCPLPPRQLPLLPYLEGPERQNYEIALEVVLQPEGGAETVISRGTAAALYYSSAQQLAHHTSSGCPMRTGDLLGSGTISGADPGSYGSLLELTRGGAEPLTLAAGERRRFLEDNDSVILRGHARGAGYRIGFGDCQGRVLPALPERARP